VGKNIFLKIIVSITILIFVLLIGCSGSNSSAESRTTTTSLKQSSNAGNGSMSAKIDGSTWNSVATTATYNNGSLIISGADTSNPPHALGMGVVATGPGTFQVNQQSPANATLINGSATWVASIVGGSGTIIITSLTSTSVSGTFSFTMIPTPGSTSSGNKVITEGVFNVTFSTPATISTQPPGGNASVTAQVNGASWSSVVDHSSYQSQILSITAIDAKGTIITIGVKATASGTYSVAYQNSDGSSAIFSNASQGWNTFLPGGTGSVTINTLSSTRATGTFSFDGAPATGSSSGTIHVTNGQFNVTL
jgi:hypothetical protein